MHARQDRNSNIYLQYKYLDQLTFSSCNSRTKLEDTNIFLLTWAHSPWTNSDRTSPTLSTSPIYHTTNPLRDGKNPLPISTVGAKLKCFMASTTLSWAPCTWRVSKHSLPRLGSRSLQSLLWTLKLKTDSNWFFLERETRK